MQCKRSRAPSPCRAAQTRPAVSSLPVRNLSAAAAAHPSRPVTRTIVCSHAPAPAGAKPKACLPCLPGPDRLCQSSDPGRPAAGPAAGDARRRQGRRPARPEVQVRRPSCAGLLLPRLWQRRGTITRPAVQPVSSLTAADPPLSRLALSQRLGIAAGPGPSRAIPCRPTRGPVGRPDRPGPFGGLPAEPGPANGRVDRPCRRCVRAAGRSGGGVGSRDC